MLRRRWKCQEQLSSLPAIFYLAIHPSECPQRLISPIPTVQSYKLSIRNQKIMKHYLPMIAWTLTLSCVRTTREFFRLQWKKNKRDDGWVTKTHKNGKHNQMQLNQRRARRKFRNKNSYNEAPQERSYHPLHDALHYSWWFYLNVVQLAVTLCIYLRSLNLKVVKANLLEKNLGSVVE